MIDEVKLRKKKDEEINYMSEPLQKAWTNFEPVLAHVTQLFQCRWHMRCLIYFVKLLKIWFDLHLVHVQIKHRTVQLLVGDISALVAPTLVSFH
jgi:hypothetical protein